MTKTLATGSALFAALLGPCLPVALAEPPTKHYHNERFGFDINYPADFTLAPSDNRDGVLFHTTVSGADLRVFSGLNALGQSVTELIAAVEDEIRQAGGSVTYVAKRNDGFVVSGVIGARVRYERVLLADLSGHSLGLTSKLPITTCLDTFWAEYPVRNKAILDSIVGRMALSLRPGPAE